MTGISYRVIGMDCASDAAEIEAAVRRVAGVGAAKVSVGSHTLTLQPTRGGPAPDAVEAAVTGLGYRLVAESADGERGVAAGVTEGYRRSLAIVVILNLGYGAVEMAGGFLADSQALKADALDFLGDGLISLLGLAAIAWSARWRARSALLQGLFLGGLGTAVLATTVYRLLFQRQPDPEIMGALGLVALAVNMAAAIVLVPHRHGDANARAIWLFSRNDAIGNAAVVLAALLVGLVGSAWPDLVVAFVIAGLFLHASLAIVRDARGELKRQAPSLHPGG